MKTSESTENITSKLLNLQNSLAICTVHTQRAYARWNKQFIRDSLPNKRIDLAALDVALLIPLLNKPVVSAWLASLKEKGLGKQSIGQARASLVWLATQLDIQWPNHEFDLVALRLQQITVPRAEEGQRPGTWLTNPQIRALIKAVKIVQKRNVALAARDRAMLLILILCGLRREELVSATWLDCIRQGEHPVLRVHGKGQKLRLVKLPVEVVNALDHWRSTQATVGVATYIFTGVLKNGRPTLQSITTQTVMERVQSLAEQAGLPKISPHDLRRTFARSAFEAGAPLEAIRQTLGHTSISTTERYVKATLELDHTATDIFAQALRNRKRALDSLAVKGRNVAALPELVTRRQAAEYLGISMPQFDTLKKRAKINAVRSTEEHPATNAKTRPYTLYRREDVDTLTAEADRLAQPVTKR